MTAESATIVQRLWNYCNVLRDDGVSYGDYVEQLTYLLFLKMADEQVRELSKDRVIPQGLGWQSLLARDGDELPDPDVLAAEIMEDLQAALEQFREIAEDLGS